MNILVAYDEQRAIGGSNDLLWKVGEMREDMRRVRQLTIGQTIYFGRKTLESLNMQALPNRRNIAISRTLPDDIPNIEVARSLEEAYDLGGQGDDTFIFGGEQLYQEVLARDEVNRIYATEVQATISGADRYFPAINPQVWREVDNRVVPADQNNLYDSEFKTYERI